MVCVDCDLAEEPFFILSEDLLQEVKNNMAAIKWIMIFMIFSLYCILGAGFGPSDTE
ncbi:hypothetical protein GCM10011339_24990 [Echinicola rosea]|uniref:Uncharacterized protein n=1 Tax=Echinicola rosea TaxID=1807691 RepID=A0ABQ1V4C3_9BACT|nr:hypothetical protein GCM10011339_24990 [Echinicola rosea]